MTPNRSNQTTSLASGAVGAGLLLLCACGQQAGADYRGEPLLRMRGQAVVSARTGGQVIEPALCFFMADKPEPPAFDPNTLPSDIRAELSESGSLEVQIDNPRHAATHILDVESRGEFPAQFDVDVYLPPPEIGLSAPGVAGEPRWAQGHVCGVPAKHPAVTFRLASGGHVDDTHGEFRYAIASTQTPRFYYEAYDCPPGTQPQFATECTKSSAGDPSLAYEFSTTELQSESVLGTAHDFEVLYLEEAALPGSFAAWAWGAANGLSAGYHLFPRRDLTKPPFEERWRCLSDAVKEAERVNQERYGARIKQEFGEDFTYNARMARNSDGSSVVQLPEELFLGAREVENRLRMEHCAFEPREELDPNLARLSIDISSNASPDLSQHFGFETIGPEE